MSDTSPTIQAMQDEAIRRLGPEARMRLAWDLSELARAFFRAGLEAREGPVTDRRAAVAWARAALMGDRCSPERR
ncbi:MAG TPA: hypothetical protein VJ773_05630 [Gemmatimonadales bacterium]|nr:hypothetical protein [Gemmatimonadales bacterium]